MKNYIKSLIIMQIISLIVTILLYVGIGFIKCNYDANSWNEECRATIVFAYLSLFILSFPLAGIIDNTITK